MPPPRETLLDRAGDGRRAGDRDREDRRPLRRPRRRHVAPDDERRRRPRPARGGDGGAGSRAAVRSTWSTSTPSTGIATTWPASPPTSSASTRRLARVLAALGADDLLIVTADHGNDPGDAEHRPLARVRAAAGARAAASPRRGPGHPANLRRPRPDAGRVVRRPGARRTAPACCRPCGESRDTMTGRAAPAVIP